MEFRHLVTRFYFFAIKVSILVFLDMEFRLHFLGPFFTRFMFQSLFFWIWNSDCTSRNLILALKEFQSLFFWIWNSDIPFLNITLNFKLFQSLFFWIWNSDFLRFQVCLKYHQSFNPYPATNVSILVFLDMEFRPGGSTNQPWWRNVSILVFLDMEFRQSTDGDSGSGIYGVSILVFLDMEFRLCRETIKLETEKSFNPCFSGYGIQT